MADGGVGRNRGAARLEALDDVRVGKRLLATRRKAKQQRADKYSSYDKRKSQILTTDKAAHQLKLMSEEYELDRSEFVDRLAMWLAYSESGQAAV